ncbi:MAG: AmmeMemoRadiSam system protein B [Calditrichia bacterium]
MGYKTNSWTKMSNNLKVRPPAVAGMFYPEKKISLDQEIAKVLEESREIDLQGEVIGMVVPHAGYMFSGGVAARAYRQIFESKIDIVVVIAPSHCEYFTEISIYNGYGYSTPLGTLPVDKELAQELAEQSPQIVLSEKGHRFEEHALEVQLPFLQKVFDNFRFVPIVMGEHSHDNIQSLADGLAQVLKDKKSIIVASSDLSHFYDDEKANSLDQVVVNDIENFDEEKLFQDLQNGECEMCGGGPAVATMKASKLLGANKSQVLLYRNSGDITGDRSEVVGYLSAVFVKQLIK